MQQITEIEEELKCYLKEQEKFFGCRLQYVGKDKNRYEIEVPENRAKKAGDKYHLEGQRKGKNPVRRFSTAETRQMLKEMIAAEDEKNKVLKDLLRRMFERFSQEYEVWKKVVDCVGILDCLTAFTVYGQNENQICFPEIVEAADSGPVIEIEDGYHPCMTISEDFIPNSITLGKTTAPMALLTGPNMVRTEEMHFLRENLLQLIEFGRFHKFRVVKVR